MRSLYLFGIIIAIIVFLFICSCVSRCCTTCKPSAKLHEKFGIIGDIFGGSKAPEWDDISPVGQPSGSVPLDESGEPVRLGANITQFLTDFCAFKMIYESMGITPDKLMGYMQVQPKQYATLSNICANPWKSTLQPIYPPAYTCQTQIVGQDAIPQAPVGPGLLEISTDEWNSRLATPTGRAQIVKMLQARNTQNAEECRKRCEAQKDCITFITSPTVSTRVISEEGGNGKMKSYFDSNCITCSGSPSVNSGAYPAYTTDDLHKLMKRCGGNQSEQTASTKAFCDKLTKDVSDKMCPSTLNKVQGKQCNVIKEIFSSVGLFGMDHGSNVVLKEIKEKSPITYNSPFFLSQYSNET